MEGDEVEVATGSGDAEEPTQEDPGLEAGADGRDARENDLRPTVRPSYGPGGDPQQLRVGDGTRPRLPEDDEVRLVPDLPLPDWQSLRAATPELAAAAVAPNQGAEERGPRTFRPCPERRARLVVGEPRRGSVDHGLDRDALLGGGGDLAVERPEVVLARAELALGPVDREPQRPRHPSHPRHVLAGHWRLRRKAEESGRRPCGSGRHGGRGTGSNHHRGDKRRAEPGKPEPHALTCAPTVPGIESTAGCRCSWSGIRAVPNRAPTPCVPPGGRSRCHCPPGSQG